MALAITMAVEGVDELATNFATLSDRAHKKLIPDVLEASTNRLNDAIVKNIPVGDRGGVPEVYFTGTEAEIAAFQWAQEEREVAAEEGISVQTLRRWVELGVFEPSFEELPEWVQAEIIALQEAQEEREVAAEEGISILELRRRYSGRLEAGTAAWRKAGWRATQARMVAMGMPSGERHTTTYAVPLPSKEELGIQADESYYPFNVEYGTRFAAAMAPIRKAVNRLEKSEFGEILDLLGHGLGALAIIMGPALLLRKAIFGRSTPKEFMPIDYSRARPGDSL